MSDSIYDGNGLYVTRFYGGEHRGICFQFDTCGEYAQLTFAQTENMLEVVLEEIKRIKREYKGYRKR